MTIYLPGLDSLELRLVEVALHELVEVTFHEPGLGLIEVILPILVPGLLKFPVFPSMSCGEGVHEFYRERTGGSVEDVYQCGLLCVLLCVQRAHCWSVRSWQACARSKFTMAWTVGAHDHLWFGHAGLLVNVTIHMPRHHGQFAVRTASNVATVISFVTPEPGTLCT